MEVYNLDKENHPLLVRDEKLMVVQPNCNMKRCLIAESEKLKLYSNNDALILKGISFFKIPLKCNPGNRRRLNWCRNKSYSELERQKIIRMEGYDVAD